jgi:hypothetical protein
MILNNTINNQKLRLSANKSEVDLDTNFQFRTLKNCSELNEYFWLTLYGLILYRRKMSLKTSFALRPYSKSIHMVKVLFANQFILSISSNCFTKISEFYVIIDVILEIFLVGFE